MVKQFLILVLVALLGANIVAAQSASAQSAATQECDPYAGGTSPNITIADLNAPATDENALAMHEIGINPDVLLAIADNITEVDPPVATFADSSSHLEPASAAVVTSAVDRLKVYDGICSDTQVLGELWAGQRVTVLEGPLASEGLAWWRVRRNNLTGWVIEGEDNQLWLQGL